VIVLQGPQSFPFGDLGVALRLNLSLAFAICIFGLREDPEEVFTLLRRGQIKLYLLEATGKKGQVPTVLTTLPDLSITAIVSPNGGILTGKWC
jgi:hypothetical protein